MSRGTIYVWIAVQHENKQKERQYCYTNGTFFRVFTNLTVEELRDEWKITCSVFLIIIVILFCYFF